MKKIILPVVVASVLLIIFSLCSKPFLGDEIYHLRFAKDAYNSNSRPVFDSQYGTLKMPTILYTSPPLWNLLLALLWKITGGISTFVAQFYQVIFYVIIILFTYLITKELYSEKDAKISSLLVATVPMILSFSIILYTDIPVVALSLVGIFFIIKKKFLPAGLFWSFAFLTKNNSAFFIPAIISLLFFSTDNKIIAKLKNALLTFMPLCILYYMDFWWRSNAFSNASIGVIQGISPLKLSHETGIFGTWKAIISNLWFSRISPKTFLDKLNPAEYLNSHLLNIKDLFMYLGIVLLILAILYILRKKYEKKDMYVGVFIISYLISTFVVIGWNTDIRYFMPIVPLLCILFSKSISDINNTWIKRLLICACIFQFIVTVSYVSYKRNITPQIEGAFNFIKNNTPVNSLLLYPEPNIQEYAKRKVIWSNFKPSTSLRNVFWPENINTIRDTISSNNIDYIVIKKTRCYNDVEVKHIGGYPDSFVKKLPDYKFVKLIFDNKEIAVWKIEKQYL